MTSLRFSVVLLCICLLAGAQGTSRCDEPKVVGFCRARIRRFYFNKRISQCLRFNYGGCGGNSNNFETLKDCEKTCVNHCEQPKTVGRCRMYIPRFYFNKKTLMCEPFIYGGCGGNLNNFETFKDCEETCAVPQCLEPKEVGRCRGYFPRYYFNRYTLKCEGFIYGGCGANRNNFETMEDCKTACLR